MTAPAEPARNIILHEVGLRDGLQAEKQLVPLEAEDPLDRRPPGRRR